MTDDEKIPVHAKSWNQRELFTSILSRYCVILEDLGGRSPTFLVGEKKDQDIHEVLQDINTHIKKLGFNARLFPDEPWILQLIPDPRHQWPSPRFVITMWLFSLITTIYAAEKWMNSGRPIDGWFVSNASLDALIGYTIPLFVSLIIASFVQNRVARKHGVNLPHIFPIPGPAMLWWPFGILGFASLPRSDARLWPDRSAMGNTALSAPLVMVVFGMVLIFIGLSLTPELVLLNSVPFVVELPFLANLFALFMEGERLVFLKTTWAHPFTRAGMTLTFFGWVSLLPIPTFPGGRILIARMGIPEARSGSSQVMLLLVVLLFAFLFGAFSEWNIWVPIVAICASMLITRGSDPTMPIVLDDFKGLPEADHRRLGIILFMVFMFALPAQLPFAEDTTWDDDLSFNFSDDTLKIEEGWFNQSITITNPSLLEKPWRIEYLSGPFGQANLSQIDCFGGKQSAAIGCEGNINPLSSLTIEFNFEWMEDWNTAGFELVWYSSIGYITNSVIPEQKIFPLGNWEFNGDYDDPEACVTIDVNSNNDSITLSEAPALTTWKGIDESGNYSVSKGENQLCLDGLSGDNLDWLSEIIFEIDNHSFSTGYQMMEIISIPNSGIILDSDELLFPFSNLAVNYNGTCDDLGIVTPPTTIVNNTTIWDMRVLKSGKYDLENSSSEIKLLAESKSVISVCTESYLPEKYTVSNGPNIIVYKGEDRTQNWIGEITVINDTITIENPMEENLSISVEFDGNGEQWQISNSIEINSNSVANISAIAPSNGISFVWLELDEGDVILHLVNHEV